jgi:protein-S-isoprenylcysteine O-methyltransferase Ste14
MTDPLARRAFISGAVLFAVMAGLLFGSAGTLRWWQGWVFLAAYFGWAVGISWWLIRRDPALFARRMRGGPAAEKHAAQRVIMTLASVAFVALLVVPGLDRRFGWSAAPGWVTVLGLGLFSLGWLAIMWVFRENSFTAATVEVMPGQRVVATGPYAMVRHPMYLGALVMLAGIPLALGSWWGLAAMVPLVPVLAWRLLDEEEMLTRELAGYAEYRAKLRWRLLPGVW